MGRTNARATGAKSHSPSGQARTAPRIGCLRGADAPRQQYSADASRAPSPAARRRTWPPGRAIPPALRSAPAVRSMMPADRLTGGREVRPQSHPDTKWASLPSGGNQQEEPIITTSNHPVPYARRARRMATHSPADRRAQRTAECRWTMAGTHSGTPRAHRREAVPKSGVDLCLSAAQRAAGSRCRRAGVLRCRARGQSSPGRQPAAQAARWPSRRPARHLPRRQPDRRVRQHCHVLDIGHRSEISHRLQR
jgi:hypothetical protein